MRARRLLCILIVVATSSLVPASAQATQYFLTTILRASSVIPPVFTAGGGAVDLLVDDTNGHVEWVVLYSGLIGQPTGLHVHAGAPGVNGPRILTLASGAVSSGTIDTATAAPAVVDQLLHTPVYVVLTTTEYPNGEVRGNLLNTGPIPTAPASWGQVKLRHDPR